MDDILSTAHELILHAAIVTTDKVVYPAWGELSGTQPEVIFPNLATVNRTLQQEVEITKFFTVTVYATHPGWLAGAFAVIVLACLSIIPTYWGWWHLGRPVSMSVLEIAKAFDAPLLRDLDPNGSAEEHLRIVGRTRVRYGFGTTRLVHEKDGNGGQPSLGLSTAPQLDLNIIEVNDFKDKNHRVQHQDTISIVLETATNSVRESRDQIEGGPADMPLQMVSTAFPASADRTTNDSSLPQAFEKESESFTVQPTLMFREVDSFSSGRGD